MKVKKVLLFNFLFFNFFCIPIRFFVKRNGFVLLPTFQIYLLPIRILFNDRIYRTIHFIQSMPFFTTMGASIKPLMVGVFLNKTGATGRRTEKQLCVFPTHMIFESHNYHGINFEEFFAMRTHCSILFPSISCTHSDIHFFIFWEIISMSAFGASLFW